MLQLYSSLSEGAPNVRFGLKNAHCRTKTRPFSSKVLVPSVVPRLIAMDHESSTVRHRVVLGDTVPLGTMGTGTCRCVGWTTELEHHPCSRKERHKEHPFVEVVPMSLFPLYIGYRVRGAANLDTPGVLRT